MPWVRIKRLFVLVLVGALSCVEPYTPPRMDDAETSLAIDGFLDTNQKTLTVKVYRAISLSDPDQPVPFSQAEVSLETDDGGQFDVPYQGEGIYAITGIKVDTARRYRIRVGAQHRTFFSRFVKAQQTEPIDSLAYSYDNDYLYVYLFTQASPGIVHYFRWNFDETWAYHAKFRSGYAVENDQIVPRTQQIYDCWLTRSSSEIDVRSTESLINNTIKYHLLTKIPYNSIKLSSKYSILARQYSISKEEFQFWGQLASTTENLGSLFDAQPTQVNGNIVADDGGQQIGYFSVGNFAELRLTIDAMNIPYVKRKLSYGDCGSEDYDQMSASLAVHISNLLRLLSIVNGGASYTYAYSTCADCTIYGGTNVKPDYW